MPIFTKTLDAGTFAATLPTIKKGGATLSNNIQNCAIFAMDAFANCKTVGNECQKLSELRDTVRNTRGANVTKFDAYIVAHCNVETSVNSDKKFIFKIKSGEAPHVVTPEIMWDQMKGSGKPAEMLSEEAILKDLIKKSERSMSTATLDALATAEALVAYMKTTTFANAKLKAKAQREAAIIEAKDAAAKK